MTDPIFHALMVFVSTVIDLTGGLHPERDPRDVGEKYTVADWALFALVPIALLVISNTA